MMSRRKRQIGDRLHDRLTDLKGIVESIRNSKHTGSLPSDIVGKITVLNLQLASIEKDLRKIEDEDKE